jgi:hypothetical protein
LLVYELLRCGFSLAAASGMSRRSCMVGGSNCMKERQIRCKARISGTFRFGAQSAYRQTEFEKEIDHMKNLPTIALAAFTGCIGLALLPSLQADAWDKKTNLTISEPLEVPDCCTPDHTITLQPGEYVMVLVDSLSDRHIVRIFDKDQKHVMTTILAIPNYRLQPTGKTVLQYWEVPAGQPRALRAWFYPGDNFGQEFAYPKEKAAQIAAFVKAPVPVILVETTAAEDLKTVPLLAVDEGGKTTEIVTALPVRAPEVALQPAPAASVAVVTETPAPVPEPVQPAMPHTASSMPLVGLAGLLSLAIFAALGFRSSRSRPCKA